LRGHQCLFGGGTALALRHGEYRESVDIHFMVSHRDGYRALRQLLSGPAGVKAVCRAGIDLGSVFTQTREVRADQYGIRTMLRVADVEIKFEIVLEARITLDAPGAGDLVCGVATLTPPKALLRQAIVKAQGAYGDSIEADLRGAIQWLRERAHRLDHCMQAMRMTTVPKALLWKRIKALEPAG